MATVVYTAGTAVDAQHLTDYIYKMLTKEPSSDFTVVRKSVSNVEVYDLKAKLLVRKYVTLVIPAFINLAVLDGFTGMVEYRLDETINQLECIIAKLRAMQGRRYIERKDQHETLYSSLRELG